VKDITHIETEGMNEAQIAEVRQFMARLGVSDPRITHPTTTLEDLFMRVIRDNTPGGLATSGNGNGNAPNAPAAANDEVVAGEQNGR